MGNFLGIKQGDKIRMLIGDYLNAFIYECKCEPGKYNPEWRKIINQKNNYLEKNINGYII